MKNREVLGTWHNRYGSVLTIDGVGEDGALRGTFCVGVGPSCGQSFPVAGVVDGESFALIVSFGPERMASWIGRARATEDVLDATWTMRSNRTVTGVDIFWRGEGARLDRPDPGHHGDPPWTKPSPA